MTLPAWPAGSADVLERELLARWAEEDLFAQTLAQGADGEPYVFFEGPPTANGRPGIHHVFARTIKDLFCRYQAMQGKRVTRIAGWDTHGLPVEIEVEKQLQLSGKRDIEAFGVAEFNRLCRESVFRYRREWERLSDRIAFWLDYEHAYVTCSNEYVESVWSLLARLHERGLLARGHRVLPYCPRCGTVLSSHELALGYEEVQTNSVYVTFPLADDPARQLLVWTTTPWTLLSNAAVAVHPDLEYGEYDLGDRRVILATARAGLPSGPGRDAPTFADLGPVRTFPGRELAGARYLRPLEVVELPADRAARVVITAPFVTAEDGSGLVHLAPAFGADDFQAGQEHGLALVRPVAADGTLEGTTWAEVEGRRVTDRETADLIIQRLKADGRWHLTVPHRHTYPHCWRCQSPLIYYARDSWFVRTSAVRERMLELNAQVNWQPPEVGSGRFGEWLANNVDWALSRDRYWGTPLPVWVCDADPSHVEVIGSYAALAAAWGQPLPGEFDPHKPGVDAFTWGCTCGGTMRRTPEVIDTWFDSGAMPYAQWHWPFEGEQEFRSHFPADFICEGVDQTRGWFYSLLAIAATAFDALPYRNVVVNELVLDARGQKMSKSRGNAVDPWEVIEAQGADALRLYLLAASQVWLPKRFDTAAIGEASAGFLNTLRNTYAFLALYAGADDAPARPPAERPLADRWVLGRLAQATGRVREAWDAYDATAGVRAVMEFVVEDLSNWYVRTNRARFWAPDRSADPDAVATLREVLQGAGRLLAPAAPFVSDWLHRALGGGSVHLAPFPEPAAVDDALDRAMEAVRRAASLGRAAREEAGIRVRQPLGRMQVAVAVDLTRPEHAPLVELLRQEVNVKAIEFVTASTELVHLRARPNFRALGARFGKRTPVVARAVEALGVADVRRLEAGEPVALELEGDVASILPADVAIERTLATEGVMQAEAGTVVVLDPTLDEALREEGLARELVNRIQRLRKDAGYDYTARVAVALRGDAALEGAARRHAGYVQGETLARELAIGQALDGAELEQDVDIDGRAARLGIARLLDGRPAAKTPHLERQ